MALLADYARITLKEDKTITVPMVTIAGLTNLVRMLDSAAPVLDPADGITKKTITIPTLTVENLTMAIMVAAGGSCDACDPTVLRMLGVMSPKVEEVSASLSRISIPPNVQFLGSVGREALILTGIVGPQDEMWDTCLGQNDRFPPIYGVPGGSRYAATLVSVPQGHDAPTGAVVFPLGGAFTDFLDAMHTLVLKVTFPSLKLSPQMPIVNTRELMWVDNLLDVLFDTVSLEIGGREFESKPLTLNNFVARTHKLWPSTFNTARPNSEWTATIPLMMFPTVDPSSPLLSAAWKGHGARIVLKQVAHLASLIRRRDNQLESMDLVAPTLNPIRYELVAEGVMYHDRTYADSLVPLFEVEVLKGHDVDCASCVEQRKAAETQEKTIRERAEESRRMAVETESRRKEVERVTPSMVSIKADKEALEVIGSVMATHSRTPEPVAPLRTVPIQRMPCKKIKLAFSRAAGYQAQVDIRDFISFPCTAIMIMLHPQWDVGFSSLFPIRGATLVINGKDVLRFDCCDLHEWNWLKCGMEPPMPKVCALMPFSRFAYQAGKHAIINIGCAQNVSLRLDLNPEVAAVGWSATVAGVCRDLMQYGNYTCVSRF